MAVQNYIKSTLIVSFSSRNSQSMCKILYRFCSFWKIEWKCDLDSFSIIDHEFLKQLGLFCGKTFHNIIKYMACNICGSDDVSLTTFWLSWTIQNKLTDLPFYRLSHPYLDIIWSDGQYKTDTKHFLVMSISCWYFNCTFLVNIFLQFQMNIWVCSIKILYSICTA